MNKLQTKLNDKIGRRTEIARSGSKMTETRSDAYGYNMRSELTNAVKNATLNEYAYQYDDIGNRETSVEPDGSFTYTANELNQYTQISAVNLNLQPQPSFTPAYDLDGNQTLVKTATGIWSVTYNGENRPVRWERIEQSEQSTNRTILEMKFDRMGRRVEYIESVGSITNKHQKFVYDGYLCVQRLNGASNSITELFEWDPTEKVATRPMFMQYRVPGQTYALFYTHDGNKNVSEVVHFSRANGVAAHYEYAPFGEVTAQVRQGGITAYDFAALNPWRFSSEYADDAIGMQYYNFRFYNSIVGRWNTRDKINESGSKSSLYAYVSNGPIYNVDLLGCLDDGEIIRSITINKKDVLWGAIIWGEILGGEVSTNKDTYGHWWIEIGSESYGWWPIRSLSSLHETITGVPGELNGTTSFGGYPTRDPHHGESADQKFNPKVDFGGAFGYFQNREIEYGPKSGTKCKCLSESDIIDGIRAFAVGFTGEWSYPFGQNCHTFVNLALEGNCLEEQ